MTLRAIWVDEIIEVILFFLMYLFVIFLNEVMKGQ